MSGKEKQFVSQGISIKMPVQARNQTADTDQFNDAGAQGKYQENMVLFLFLSDF